MDPSILKAQITKYAPPDAQQILASAGVRDEHVFPVPVVLSTKPTLVGYYRLLLGLPQKTFYGTGTGMGQFKSMETRGLLTEVQKDRLPDFCEAMGQSLADLVRQISPMVTPRDVVELALLTIGSQFQGGQNNTIGKQAIEGVYLAIGEIVEGYTTARDSKRITVRNPLDHTFTITLAGDPDVRIEEVDGMTPVRKVAIEVKGGTDRSNAHNRAGEAEKSHQKAKGQGFPELWTIITQKGLDMKQLRIESPTTTVWFDTAQVLARLGPDWEDLKRRVTHQVGIPLPPT